MFAIRSTRMKFTAFLAVLALAGTSSVAVADEQAPDVEAVVAEEQQPLDVDASSVEPTPVVDAELEQTIEESEQAGTDMAPPLVVESEPASSDAPTQAADEAHGDVADTEVDNTDSVEEPESELELAATNVIPDKNFRACVNIALGYEKEQTRAVTAAQMKTLELINCDSSSKPASSFEGIQYAVNATNMDLLVANGANVSALSKLSSTKLTALHLQNFGGDSKVGAFPDMTKASELQTVYMYRVTFSNYANLAKIRHLSTLSVYRTSLKDISFVSKLTTVKYLYLRNGSIVDMTPVTGLKNLLSLDLSYNKITSLPKPKAAIKNLYSFDLQGNRIKDFRNASAWTKAPKGEQYLFRIKPVFKNGNTEIDISSFYDAGGTRPVKAYLAERKYDYADIFRPLTARTGTIVNGGKTARFTGKLAEGQLVWIENKTAGAYVIRVGDSKVRKIELSPTGSLSVMVGGTRWLKAVVTPKDALNTAVAWKSSNTAVATVNSEGKVTGKKAGMATITATAKDGSGVKASVKITVVNVVNEECSLRPGPRTFADVPASHPFAKDISWLSQKGISKGWPDNTFGPQLSVHRDAFAAFLYRMACEPWFTPPTVSPFKDVPTNHPFYKEITWAASEGITKGWSDGTFRPDAPITRDAIAAFLYRFAGSPKFTVTKSFKDIAGNEHRKAIEWLGSTGISTGWPDGTYRPGLFTERGAIAAFLHRYSDKKIPIAVR